MGPDEESGARASAVGAGLKESFVSEVIQERHDGILILVSCFAMGLVYQ